MGISPIDRDPTKHAATEPASGDAGKSLPTSYIPSASSAVRAPQAQSKAASAMTGRPHADCGGFILRLANRPKLARDDEGGQCARRRPRAGASVDSATGAWYLLLSVVGSAPLLVIVRPARR